MGPIPYGNQTEENSLIYEDGYKGVRGSLTEGRYLVFQSNGYALSIIPGETHFNATIATPSHESKNQRWVIHGLAEEGAVFNITSAVDGSYMAHKSSRSTDISDAESYNITYIGSSLYTMQKSNGHYMNINPDGTLAWDSQSIPYSVFSVTYN